MSAEGLAILFSSLGAFGFLIFFLTVLVWFFLPFAVFGIKGRLDSILVLLRILAEQGKKNQVTHEDKKD